MRDGNSSIGCLGGGKSMDVCESDGNPPKASVKGGKPPDVSVSDGKSGDTGGKFDDSDVLGKSGRGGRDGKSDSGILTV